MERLVFGHRPRRTSGFAILLIACLHGCDSRDGIEPEPSIADATAPATTLDDTTSADTASPFAAAAVAMVGAYEASLPRPDVGAASPEVAAAGSNARSDLVDIDAPERPFAESLSGRRARDWLCHRQSTDGSVTSETLTFRADGHGLGHGGRFTWFLAEGELRMLGAETRQLRDLRVAEPRARPETVERFEARDRAEAWTCSLAH